MSIIEHKFDDALTLGRYWMCRCDPDEGHPFIHPRTHRKCLFCLTHREDGRSPRDAQMNTWDVAYLPGDTVILDDGRMGHVYNVSRQSRKARVWLTIWHDGTCTETVVHTPTLQFILQEGDIVPTSTALGQRMFNKLEE